MILSLFMSFALAQTIQGIRPDILNSSDDYLNARITKEQFYQSLEKWNQMGWSEEEKNLVIDTIQKSFDSSKEKNQWLCNLSAKDFCDNKKYFSTIKWPEYLEHYDTLVFAGQTYPKHQWNSLILNGKNRFMFISTKFSTIEAYGEADQLSLPLEPTLLSKQSDKTDKKSFYEKHKRKIWWTVGGVLIASGVFSLAGKKLVITKGF